VSRGSEQHRSPRRFPSRNSTFNQGQRGQLVFVGQRARSRLRRSVALGGQVKAGEPPRLKPPQQRQRFETAVGQRSFQPLGRVAPAALRGSRPRCRNPPARLRCTQALEGGFGRAVLGRLQQLCWMPRRGRSQQPNQGQDVGQAQGFRLRGHSPRPRACQPSVLQEYHPRGAKRWPGPSRKGGDALKKNSRHQERPGCGLIEHTPRMGGQDSGRSPTLPLANGRSPRQMAGARVVDHADPAVALACDPSRSAAGEAKEGRRGIVLLTASWADDQGPFHRHRGPRHSRLGDGSVPDHPESFTPGISATACGGAEASREFSNSGPNAAWISAPVGPSQRPWPISTSPFRQ